eukprot:10991304-Lingulodinium_polyedra.AAC.1
MHRQFCNVAIVRHTISAAIPSGEGLTGRTDVARGGPGRPRASIHPRQSPTRVPLPSCLDLVGAQSQRPY